MSKIFNKDFLRGAATVGIITILFSFHSSFGALPKLNAIRPAANQTVALSDEQQGILAVRSAKASVVSILGATPKNPTSTTSGISAYAVTTIYGSGFIIDSSGIIVSNGHVVQDSSLVYSVMLTDGTQYSAKVLGLDKYDDIAILKIDAKGLPAAKLGDSGVLETGQTVFAIGNSLGRYQNTVTKGVVSGLGRVISEPNETGVPSPRLLNLIQTDAAINPGNSGGPLIDMAGAVIGMNTLIDTQGSNVGFSIPINTIKDVADQLQKSGKVSKSYMGVQFATVNGQLKILNNLSVSEGAYINLVTPGGPAAAAGLEAGDVIVAINHEKITLNNELDTVVSKYQPGTQVLVTFIHNGQQTDAVMVLGVLK
jgi:S1-C subfamily serine protease